MSAVSGQFTDHVLRSHLKSAQGGLGTSPAAPGAANRPAEGIGTPIGRRIIATTQARQRVARIPMRRVVDRAARTKR